MESSSSLGEYSGGAQAATTSGSSSSGVTVTGRKLYPFERGFCYIPKEDWTKGLEKQRGQSTPFYVSSLRHALIVPAGYSYPHLTLDVQESYFQHKVPPYVKVRISDAHFSPGQRLPRLGFHCRGAVLFPDGWFDRDVLLRVQGYLERSPFPFRLEESLLTEQSEPAPVTATGEIEPQASSSASGDAPERQEEQSLADSSDSPTSSVRPKGKRHKSRSSKQKAVKKAVSERPAERPAEQAMAVEASGSDESAMSGANVTKAAEDDVEKLWLDALNLENFVEALDTLTVHQFSDEDLKFAATFYRLGIKNVLPKIEDYIKKSKERSLAALTALAGSAKLIGRAAQERGSKRKNYQQAAQRVTQKSVEGNQMQTGGESAASQEALDYGLHQIVPADLMDERFRPDGTDQTRFKGYQCAMLLLFRMLAMGCHELRCTEFYSRAYFQCTHIAMVCKSQARKLRPYFKSMESCLDVIMDEIDDGSSARKSKGEINADALKRAQDSLEPLREWHENAIQVFYQFTSVLAEISNQLPSLSQQDWQRLTDSVAAELEIPASLNMKDQDHWQQALQSLERVRDQLVQSGASTSTESSG